MTFEAVDEVVGRKRTLEVLSAVEEHRPARYSVIDETVETSSDIVTNRLRLLVEYGILARRERNKRNVMYDLTTRGEALLDYLGEIEVLLKRGKTGE